MFVFLLVVFIIGALGFLALGILSAVQYGKMTGVKAVDTDGTAMPTGIGSNNWEMKEELRGGKELYRKEIYKTKGKEAGVSFSLSYDDLKKGLKEKDPVVILQFKMAAGFIFFTALTVAAIGSGLLMGDNGLGYYFVGAGALLGGLFLFKTVF